MTFFLFFFIFDYFCCKRAHILFCFFGFFGQKCQFNFFALLNFCPFCGSRYVRNNFYTCILSKYIFDSEKNCFFLYYYIHYIICIYTPLCTDLGQNPVPVKKPCKPCHRCEKYFSKWLPRCSVVTSMLTPPTRN